MEQTAVEYLYKIIHARIHIDKDLSEYLEQAKEMELDRLQDAYSMGRLGGTIKEFNNTFKSE
jgi:hypothetical protein